MIEQQYLTQLQKLYPVYLSRLIEGVPYEPIFLRGGKNKPATTKELEAGIRSFLLHQKGNGKPGWEISWETWQSKKLGDQEWPVSVAVTTEGDYLHLLGKEKEVYRFREVLLKLKEWNSSITSWLAEKPQRVLELKDQWVGICAVVDYLLRQDVSGKYIRSLPVPVHTKFIQQNSAAILSLLKHMAPARFSNDAKDLKLALGLQKKPVLCTLRWLDGSLAQKHASGLEVMGAPAEALRNVQWQVEEAWVVENETNLYLIPPREKAIALFGKGYALHDLKAIPMLQKCRILYWGDLDEDGFRMLHQFRQLYPQTESLLMDAPTVLEHADDIHQVVLCHPEAKLDLTSEEKEAWDLLKSKSGRIEQEKVRQDWMLKKIKDVSIR
ncbi:MAG: hypothetical protein EOO15_02985 [Chitinophagaceae bacterium]|nr:MAG: hypothetical protein EOO15_02985 [Chitinophagaceae bacterium]